MLGLVQVLAANREARKPAAVLDGDGDTFLKNECRADKWLLLELSQVARVDTVRLAQVRCPEGYDSEDMRLLMALMQMLGTTWALWRLA